MMVGNVTVDTDSINGVMNTFTGLVIKDFYKGVDSTATQGDNELFLIIDWGLQSLSKEDYPVENTGSAPKSGVLTVVMDKLCS